MRDAQHRQTTQDTGSLDDLEVVLVSYRSRHHVEELLDLWGPQVAAVLVDNAHGADGLEELAAQRPNVRYVDGGGQGFARAANRGAMSSAKPYVAFVNPDSRPTLADLLALTAGLAQDPDAVSHAATVTGHDGDVEIGVGGWEPTIARTAAFAFGLHKRWPQRGVYAKPQVGEALDVEWTTGACMVVRTADFRTLGGFDESFFVYNEDMSFGRRARLAGRRQVLRPDVLVRHGAGGSGAPSQEMLRMRGASFANYVERYHPGLAAKAMRGSMVAGYALRAAQQRAKGDADLSAQYRAVVRGLIGRTAHVAGVEVAKERFEQTPTPAAGSTRRRRRPPVRPRRTRSTRSSSSPRNSASPPRRAACCAPWRWSGGSPDAARSSSCTPTACTAPGSTHRARSSSSGCVRAHDAAWPKTRRAR